jgi:chromosome 3 open reading frame 10
LRLGARQGNKQKARGRKKGGMARAGGISNPVNVGIAVQADWENREFISNISLNVRRLFEFLLQFGTPPLPSLPPSLSRLDPVVSSVIDFHHRKFFDHL